LARYGITFAPVLKQQETEEPEFTVQRDIKRISNQTALGIIDRMVRTLRDMAYYKRVQEITPPVMNELLRYYNLAPHKVLSDIMEFDVRPLDVENDQLLESEIIRRLIAQNHDIKNKQGFMLPVGSRVEVYNEKNSLGSKRRSAIRGSSWAVDSFNGGFFSLRNSNGREIFDYCFICFCLNV
jgi:hypothetical protein